MLIIPYQVDVPMDRRPWANYGLIAGTCLVSIAALGADEDAGWVWALVQEGFKPSGLLGSVLLHGDYLHLIGNMIFLWVFGNAVCAKVGNGLYLPIYAALGVASSVVYALFDDEPSIGASGAVNGVVGMYLVLYPLNEIDCFWMFMVRGGTFAVSSYWMILLWFAFDIFGVVTGGEGVAYWSHLGGIAAGFGLAWTMVSTRWVRVHDFERTLCNIVTGKPDPAYDTGDGDEEKEDLGPNLVTAKAAVRPAPAPQRPATPEPTAGKIVVKCACGKKLAIDRKHAGKPGRCPGCKSAFKIPAA